MDQIVYGLRDLFLKLNDTVNHPGDILHSCLKIKVYQLVEGLFVVGEIAYGVILDYSGFLDLALSKQRDAKGVASQGIAGSDMDMAAVVFSKFLLDLRDAF